jgi:hypothetical protein
VVWAGVVPSFPVCVMRVMRVKKMIFFCRLVVEGILSSINSNQAIRSHNQFQPTYIMDILANALVSGPESSFSVRDAVCTFASAVADNVREAKAVSQKLDGNRTTYTLGDYTRGLIAKGRDTRGEDPRSGYQFGDITRGLLSDRGQLWCRSDADENDVSVDVSDEQL